MKKKRKVRSSKLISKRNRVLHIQYFYSLFAVLAVGAVLLGFMQPTSSQQVLGASDRNIEEESVSFSEFGEAVWDHVLNVLPLR